MKRFEQSEIEMDWLKQWALYSPQAIAIKDSESGAEYSYSLLYKLSSLLAMQLRDRFVIEPGARIAVLATNELEFLPLFFAAQRLGAILVPINFRLTGNEIAYILEDSRPDLLIYQSTFNQVIESIGAELVPDKRWSFDGANGLSEFINAASSAVAKNLPFQGDFESACMLLYTSGTTGLPKGAIITNKMLHWNSLSTQIRLNITQDDVTITFAPFFHTGGWNVLLTPFIHRGARTVLLKKFDAAKVLELCEKEKATMFFGVPTMLDMMASSPCFKAANLSLVRFAVVGGEPMPIELIKTWQKKGVPIRQGFGLTEFGPNVFSLNQEDSLRKIGSIGFPNFYVQARVVDENDLDVPQGEIGELILHGPACTPGYWNQPRATLDTIRDGWLHTGDLVKQDNEGYFYVAGRKKDMFISGGENVYPVEVERAISSHPAVREVAVVGVRDEKWGEVGKAFIALQERAELSVEELLAYCTEKLAKFKIPKHIEFRATLPKSDSGKVLKRLLV